MPAMMNMARHDDAQGQDHLLHELSALRRVSLDGRKPTPEILDTPMPGIPRALKVRAGRRHVAVTTRSSMADATQQRITIGANPLREPGLLEDRITVTDSEALLKPWETVKRYRKAFHPNDQLREFACAEGMEHVK
jgi:hypothetical protein